MHYRKLSELWWICDGFGKLEEDHLLSKASTSIASVVDEAVDDIKQEDEESEEGKDGVRI